MSNPFQGTLTQPVQIVGVGLHSGKLVELNILPAPPNSGIRFQRIDIHPSHQLLAHALNVVSTNLCTTLGDEYFEVSTVEHLMAAFFGLGIDNAIVQLSSVEIPILDGSSAPFVDRFLEVGVQIQPAHRKYFFSHEPVEVRIDDQYMSYEPHANKECKDMFFHCFIDFNRSKAIGKQNFNFEFSKNTFLSLCEARTFCHMDDVIYMRDKGLALGGSLDNAVVVNNETVINNDGLRFHDEFVRHKTLDCLGDLALLSGQLCGKITIHKAGHKLHSMFMKKIIPLLHDLEPVRPTFGLSSTILCSENESRYLTGQR